MNFIEAIKLLWNVDLWESDGGSLFEYGYYCKELNLFIWADCATRIRTYPEFKIVYEFNPFVWLISKFVCNRLIRKVGR